MLKRTLVKISGKVVMLMFIVLLYSPLGSFAQTGPGDCGCDNDYDEGSPDWFICKENCPTGSVPINGNVFVLAVAGVVLFAFKRLT